jgi:hypothetical protein
MIERLMSKEVHEKQDDAETDAAAEGGSAEGCGVWVELWTRRPVCGPRTEVIDRLGALASAGALDAYEVETWPDEIALSEHTRHDRVVETYEQFRAWADDTGVSITPPFDRRTVTSLIGRTEEVLTLPVMCLAVYDDGLRGVYPCNDGGETWTVTDYLDAYEAAGGRPAEVVRLGASAD